MLRFFNALFQRGRDSRPTFPYRVRVSPKAKHIRLSIKQGVGLEVVIPQGFPAKKVPEVLSHHREWIQRHHREIAEAAEQVPGPHCLPWSIRFEAINQTFSVRYEPLASGEPYLEQPEAHTICIRANPDREAEVCCSLLQTWLKAEGRRILVPWAFQQARKQNITLCRVQIRKQKTRWGSMSSRGTLSLNCCLLFLPPRLVHHVLLHELCHILYPDHGREFKDLLSRVSPHREHYEAQLKSVGSQNVPLWAKV